MCIDGLRAILSGAFTTIGLRTNSVNMPPSIIALSTVVDSGIALPGTVLLNGSKQSPHKLTKSLWSDKGDLGSITCERRAARYHKRKYNCIKTAMASGCRA